MGFFTFATAFVMPVNELFSFPIHVNHIMEMGAGYHIIGDVVDISLSADYAAMSREERTEKIKLPIAFGAPVGKWYYYFGIPGEMIKADWQKK